jgi:hypothetical protein
VKNNPPRPVPAPATDPQGVARGEPGGGTLPSYPSQGKSGQKGIRENRLGNLEAPTCQIEGCIRTKTKEVKIRLFAYNFALIRLCKPHLDIAIQMELQK